MTTQLQITGTNNQIEYINAEDKERLKSGVDVWLKHVVSRKSIPNPTVRQNLIHDRDVLLIEWLWNTGMRISDALSIKFMDIDMNKEQVTFIIKKRSRKKPYVHMITLDKAILFEVQRYKEKCKGKPEDVIFPMSRQNAWEAFDKYAKLAGFIEHVETRRDGKITRSYFHPHILRHSMCMNDLMSGVPVEATQFRAGHKSLNTTTETYRVMNVNIERIMRNKK